MNVTYETVQSMTKHLNNLMLDGAISFAELLMHLNTMNRATV